MLGNAGVGWPLPASPIWLLQKFRERKPDEKRLYYEICEKISGRSSPLLAIQSTLLKQNFGMSINAVKQYQYQPIQPEGPVPHFEVRAIRLDTYCVANENDISEYYKIYWIEDGTGEYEIDFQSIRIEGAGIFCLSPGQVFNVRNEQVRQGYQIIFDREFYCVETHGKEIACNGVLFNNVHRAAIIPLRATDASAFRTIIDNLIGELNAPGAAHRAMLETYLRLFLIQALRIWDEQQEPDQREPEDSHLAADFIALVEKHFREVHAVSEYAELLFVSPKSLAKRLNILGYPTPTEIIHRRIILQAKRELRYTRKTVKEIAYDLGYEDPAYFSRLFSKKEGISPVKYRES